jgi:hypothetical protein
LSLGEEDGMLGWVDTKFVVESVVPDLLHIVPVGDDAVLDRILEDENTGFGASFIADGGVLVLAASNSLDVLRAPDD